MTLVQRRLRSIDLSLLTLQQFSASTLFWARKSLILYFLIKAPSSKEAFCPRLDYPFPASPVARLALTSSYGHARVAL